LNNKRDSSGSNPGPQQQPPIAHIKNDIPSAPSSSTSLNTTPIYHHHHHHNHRTQPQNTTPLGNSPIGTTAALLQPQQADIYAQAELYRRPTVFVSQASYAYNTARVVPPPAHNGNSRQVSFDAIFTIECDSKFVSFRFSQHSHYRHIFNFHSTVSLEHR
jgi:hypothetical protein